MGQLTLIRTGDQMISLEHKNAFAKLATLNPLIEVQDFIALKHPAVEYEQKVALLRLMLPGADLLDKSS